MHAIYRLRRNKPVGTQRTTRRCGRLLYQKVVTAPAPSKVYSEATFLTYTAEIALMFLCREALS